MRRFFSITIILAVAAIIATPVFSGEQADKDFGFKFGGYLKTDLIYDTTRLFPGNYLLYVQPYSGDANNEFFLTARESRLAFDFWWMEGDYKTTAYVEFDFENAGGGENKADPMLRHAFFKISKCQWSLLAGQTWDIISPLNPSTANYSVLWYQGNIGYRRPQIRFSTWKETGEDKKITLDAGISRNIGGDLDGDKIDDGADSGLPAVQGRLGYASLLGESGKMSLGFSGHYGIEKYDVDDLEEVTSWSANADLLLAFNEKVCLKGEFFTGENLGQYLGGIGQSVDEMNNPLASMGGWGMLSVKMTDRVTVNAGYGFDDPDDASWETPDEDGEWDMMSRNSDIFGNLFYSMTKRVTAILEVGYAKTEYLTRENEAGEITDTLTEYDGLRFQFALKCAIK
ncbi:MAG: hypothetical protein JW814_05130 [Candidatus Krumholzibacteriota bacterium]|nr:hypothetical protein [Candidatus Krumholzibacteriota bacterium]